MEEPWQAGLHGLPSCSARTGKASGELCFHGDACRSSSDFHQQTALVEGRQRSGAADCAVERRCCQQRAPAPADDVVGWWQRRFKWWWLQHIATPSGASWRWLLEHAATIRWRLRRCRRQEGRRLQRRLGASEVTASHQAVVKAPRRCVAAVHLQWRDGHLLSTQWLK